MKKKKNSTKKLYENGMGVFEVILQSISTATFYGE